MGICGGNTFRTGITYAAGSLPGGQRMSAKRNSGFVLALLLLAAQQSVAIPPVSNPKNFMTPSSETIAVSLAGTWQAKNGNGVVSGCLAKFRRQDNEQEFI